MESSLDSSAVGDNSEYIGLIAARYLQYLPSLIPFLVSELLEIANAKEKEAAALR